jgi:hypothetical protein
LKQQPLKNAVLQGFSLKNRKSLAKANRVLEQARTTYLTFQDEVVDYNNTKAGFKTRLVSKQPYERRDLPSTALH